MVLIYGPIDAMAYYLSGDIGGTKTLLQLSAAADARKPVSQKSFPSADFSGLAEMVETFLSEAGIRDISGSCFALAGPVHGRQVRLTNLPWVIDADELEARFNIRKLALINDFEAVAHGITALQASDILTLQQGTGEAGAVRLVVGAGTGLGVAWMSHHNDAYCVHPSEGGHMDFAATNEMQAALLRYAQQHYGHVSYERIVSGPGIKTIFEFMRDTGQATPSAALLQALQGGDAGQVIAAHAEHGGDEIAVRVMDLFMSVYGAFVGNVALASLPRGGVYIAGGIAAKIAGLMQQGPFMRAFLDKGRFAGLLASLPLHIVLNQQVGLLGANLLAQRQNEFFIE